MLCHLLGGMWSETVHSSNVNAEFSRCYTSITKELTLNFSSMHTKKQQHLIRKLSEERIQSTFCWHLVLRLYLNSKWYYWLLILKRFRFDSYMIFHRITLRRWNHVVYHAWKPWTTSNKHDFLDGAQPSVKRVVLLVKLLSLLHHFCLSVRMWKFETGRM